MLGTGHHQNTRGDQSAVADYLGHPFGGPGADFGIAAAHERGVRWVVAHVLEGRRVDEHDRDAYAPAEPVELGAVGHAVGGHDEAAEERPGACLELGEVLKLAVPAVL